MSKGDTPRKVDRRKFDEAYERVFGKGRFHRYQLTNEVVEHSGAYVRLVMDRKTGQKMKFHEGGCECRGCVEKEPG